MNKDDEIIKNAITRHERLKLKKVLADDDELSEPKKTWRPWAMAAAVLSVAAFSFWMMNETVSEKDLYAAYYQKYPNVVAPLTRSNEAASKKDKLYQNYEKGDYTSAIAGLEVLKSDTATFYLALSLMEAEDYKKAAAVLGLEDFSGSSFYLYAKWYMALSSLKMQEYSEAKGLLLELEKEDFPLSENVQLLLKDLNTK
ncbi:MAG: hypothetical protein ACI9IP_001133 [Arcticibacterium sp.]|jgi:hypothetical protein